MVIIQRPFIPFLSALLLSRSCCWMRVADVLIGSGRAQRLDHGIMAIYG